MNENDNIWTISPDELAAWTINPEYINIRNDADNVVLTADDGEGGYVPAGTAAETVASAVTGRADDAWAEIAWYEQPEPDIPFYDPYGTDIMHLEEGVDIYIEGLSEHNAVHRKFCGYFSEADMETVCSGGIAEDEAAISLESGTIVLHYYDEIVAISREGYEAVAMQARSFDEPNERYIIKIKADMKGVSIIWHETDGTVATKEPLAVMDSAFEEVFR